MTQGRSLAVALVVFSAGYLIAAFQISEPAGQYATIGPRAFPIAIGIGLLACAVWVGLTSSARRDLSSIDWRVVAMSALAFLVYLVLLEPVGYLLTTVVFIATESRLLGSRAWVRDLIVSVIMTASVYTVFTLLLGIRLPVGLIG
jgi:putative tricarboxylic transport membrane protein